MSVSEWDALQLKLDQGVSWHLTGPDCAASDCTHGKTCLLILLLAAQLRSLEAKSRLGHYSVFSFCYLEIMKKVILLSWDNGLFCCDKWMKKACFYSFLITFIRDLDCHQRQHVNALDTCKSTWWKCHITEYLLINASDWTSRSNTGRNCPVTFC